MEKVLQLENETYIQNIKKRNKLKEGLFIFSLVIYPILQFCVFYIFVNFNSIILAFENIDKNNVATFAGFSNFALFFENIIKDGAEVSMAMKNSAIAYACTMIIGFPLSMFFSYYVFKKFPFAAAYRIIVMLPTILSAMLMGLIFQKFMHSLPVAMEKIGWKNFPRFLSDDKYIFGTIVFYSIWTGFSTGTIIYSNAMNGIDKEVLESGEIDGTTYLREFWHLVLPLIFPTITTFIVSGVAGLFTFSGPLYEFYGMEAPYSSLTMGYYMMIQTLKSTNYMQYPVVAAQGIVLTIVAFPLTMLVKWLMEKFDPTAD